MEPGEGEEGVDNELHLDQALAEVSGYPAKLRLSLFSNVQHPMILVNVYRVYTLLNDLQPKLSKLYSCLG